MWAEFLTSLVGAPADELQGVGGMKYNDASACQPIAYQIAVERPIALLIIFAKKGPEP